MARARIRSVALFLLAAAGSPAAAEDPVAEAAPAKVVVFFGDSLTAGHGLAPEQAFPSLLQAKFDERGWNVKAVNAGLSGDTTAGGLRRLDWALKGRTDVFVLALGANDGLRGLSTGQMKRNLLAIIARVRQVRPKAKVVLAGMKMPANYGRAYRAKFEKAYLDAARESGATFIPFLLDGVGARPELNQADGLHPNAEGQKVIAGTVWRALEPLLR